MLVGIGTKSRRIHVTMPEELLDAVDAFVERKHRSQFIAETIAAELKRRRLSAALDEMSGSLADVDIPGWETPESAAAWVRAQRRGEPLPGYSIAIDDCTS